MMNCLHKNIIFLSNSCFIFINNSSYSLNISDAIFFPCIFTNGYSGVISFTDGLNVQLF